MPRVPPTVFTATVNGPRASTASATIAAAPSGDLVSALTAIARRSSASICATVSLASAMSATAM